MDKAGIEKVFTALDAFRIELPSWGFANTGTRFGKFIQPAAATTTEEKFSDAGLVHQITGICPTIALHVQWDFPDGIHSSEEIKKFGDRYRIQPGSINPNLFQDQQYKYGSFGNPDPEIRQHALQHTRDSINIAKQLHSRDLSLWFADGSNYPGTANVVQRKQWFIECLKAVHDDLAPDQRMLLEYKPFEPAFYHTDIADWGMALLLARASGPQSKVLVDTGHHYAAPNRSLLGFCPRACLAVSTLTTAAMPTTI
jgi:L-rhamnose isomerase/sugar isomerase